MIAANARRARERETVATIFRHFILYLRFVHFRAGGYTQEARHTSSSSFFLVTCSAGLGLSCSAQATSRRKTPVPCLPRTEQHCGSGIPPGVLFSQARKEDSTLPGTLGWMLLPVKGPEVHSLV